MSELLEAPCLFGERCTATPHTAPETCPTALLDHGGPAQPCVVCRVNTRGATLAGDKRTPLCWKCYQRISDNELAAIGSRTPERNQSKQPIVRPLRSPPHRR